MTESESSTPKVTRAKVRRLRTLNRVYLAVMALLFITVVVLVVLFNQVRIAAIGWEEQAHQHHAAANNLGKDLAELRDELASTKGELDTVSTQLVNAQERIKTQGDLISSSDDDRIVLNQHLRQYEILIAKADDTTDLYQSCQGYLDQLIVALAEPEAYAPEAIDTYREQVEEYCAYATESHDEFKEMVEDSQQGFPDMNLDGQ